MFGCLAKLLSLAQLIQTRGAWPGLETLDPTIPSKLGLYQRRGLFPSPSVVTGVSSSSLPHLPRHRRPSCERRWPLRVPPPATTRALPNSERAPSSIRARAPRLPFVRAARATKLCAVHPSVRQCASFAPPASARAPPSSQPLPQRPPLARCGAPVQIHATRGQLHDKQQQQPS